MRQLNERFSTTLIWGEALLGVFSSLIFSYMVLYTNTFEGVIKGEILEGLIRFYGALSLVFFIAVLPIGIFGAVKLHRSHKIAKALLYSILCWLLSTIVFCLLAAFLTELLLLIIFIPLAGIIYGFNYGLNNKIEASA